MHGHLSLGKLCSVSTPATFTSVLTTGGGWCGGLVASARVRAAVQDASLGQAGHTLSVSITQACFVRCVNHPVFHSFVF